ncbi:hypothetical protein [Actinomadura sp. 3N407]|uniref:hypothetical protein n=1 Tax=Actinomadura sp. 3N407 TaxID=3457423 RepID=UPI003FCDA659
MTLPDDVVELLVPGGFAAAAALPGEPFGFAGGVTILRVATEPTRDNMVGQVWAAVNRDRLLGWCIPHGRGFRLFVLPVPHPLTGPIPAGQEVTGSRPQPSLGGALALLAVHLNRMFRPAAGPFERTLVLAALADGKPRSTSELILAIYPSADGGVVHELLDVVDAHITAAIRALVESGDVTEVVLDENGGTGQIWYARARTGTLSGGAP